MFTFFMLLTFKLVRKENCEEGEWVDEVHSLNSGYLQNSC